MKYRCIVCNREFEVAEGDKPRCPSCLKVHDIEPVGGRSDEKSTKKGWMAPTIIISIVVALAVTYFAVRGLEKRPDAEVKEKDISSKAAELGVSDEKGVIPFEVTDRIRKFAEEAASDKSGVDAMKSLFDAIATKRTNRLWKPHPQQEPRPVKPISADELLSKMDEAKNEPFEALSYEIACLLLASARSIGLDAVMAEIYRFEGEKKPADTGGKLGWFGVILKSGNDDKSSPLFDPSSGRLMDSATGEVRILTDKEATAPYYGIGSMSLLVKRDAAGALKLNTLAIELAPENAYFNIGRGLIFAASGAPGARRSSPSS